MQKHLDAYAANPSDANARKVAAYLAKHPMVACMFTAEECALVLVAKSQVQA